MASFIFYHFEESVSHLSEGQVESLGLLLCTAILYANEDTFMSSFIFMISVFSFVLL